MWWCLKVEPVEGNIKKRVAQRNPSSQVRNLQTRKSAPRIEKLVLSRYQNCEKINMHWVSYLVYATFLEHLQPKWQNQAKNKHTLSEGLVSGALPSVM